MGMTWGATAVDADRAAALLQAPQQIIETLYAHYDADKPAGRAGYLDKAWHAIHFVLNQSPWEGEPPWGWVIFGGTPVSDDSDEAVPRHVPADHVRQIAAALATLPADEFARRYDAQALADAEIYPEVIWLRDGDEARDYVLSYYVQLIRFYTDAAARGDSVFTWIS
jgi:hypothetical protein